MRGNKTRPGRIAVLVLGAALLCGLMGCSPEEERPAKLEDFAHAKFGTFAASVSETVTEEHFPEAERIYFTALSDLILALKTEKVDGFVLDKIFFQGIAWERSDFSYIDEPLAKVDYAYAFPQSDRGRALKAEMDAFLLEMEERGELARLQEKWFSPVEPTEPLTFPETTGENGTLRVAVGNDNRPFSYIKNNQCTGYEVELLILFAEERGYGLDLTRATFDATLFGVESGRYDMAVYGLNPTEERGEAILFSEPLATGEMVVITYVGEEGATSLLTELREGIEKTFIRENRWMLLVEGGLVTLIISLFSALFGSLLGFSLYMMSRSVNRAVSGLARGIGRVYTRIIAGTPLVVVLMILFYVVFSDFQDISGVTVSIVGFSLTFGAFVYSHMGVSVGSVDPGQTEAAYALGYGRNRAFFRIVFPQAMAVFLPSYCGEMVALIKATAVVGYIAVNDLTRMGDIIRSNTYEAFFPLITTAVIYFLLTWAAASILNLVKRRFEPKRRRSGQILKGITAAPAHHPE